MSDRKRKSSEIDNMVSKMIKLDGSSDTSSSVAPEFSRAPDFSVAPDFSIAPDFSVASSSSDPTTSIALYPMLTDIVDTTPIVMDNPVENAPHLVTMLNDLNYEMSNTDETLTNNEREMLTRILVKKIRDAITIKQQIVELEKEGMGVDAMKQIFQELIKYYTSLAYYGYEKAPEVLTQIGALLAGSAIIGATMSSSSSSAVSAVSNAVSLVRQGELLSLFSTYLPSTASYMAGAYLLKQGGIDKPVEEIASQIVSCTQDGCVELLKLASNKMQELLESDDYSVASSSIDTISSVNESIDSMFAEADDPRLRDVELQDDVSRSPISDLTNSQDSTMSDLSDTSFVTAKGSPPIRSSSPEELLSSQGSYQGSNQTIHSGNISMPSDTGTDKSGGKSRRRNKCKKTKKRMKRNRRLTKKGKKHRKTVKHRRRKMRR